MFLLLCCMKSTKTRGLRLMERRDLHQVTELLQKYLRRFHLAPSMGEEEVAHWFLPQENIIDTYVVEVCTSTSCPQANNSFCCSYKKMSFSLFQTAGGVLTDFTSFYTLPSTVMHHPLHRSLKAAYSFYSVHTVTPLLDLMNDALILAKMVTSYFLPKTSVSQLMTDIYTYCIKTFKHSFPHCLTLKRLWF